MSPPPSSGPPPTAALILKLDTLGDLVLFAPALRAVRAAWSAARLVVIVRTAYVDLARALAPGVEWLATTLDPFVTGPADAADELARLRAAVQSLAPSLVAAATSRRNWLEAALAAACPGDARRVALGSGEPDPFFGTQLELHHGIDAATAFPEVVDTTGCDQDWERNLRLADALLGRPVPRARPSLALDEPAGAAAAQALRELGLTPHKFAICAAAGFANVAIKTWPAEKFAATIVHLRERHRLPVLLVGAESERAHLEKVCDLGGGATVWTGGAGDLPRLAGLIAQAALFVGNDTGALHLAAALDVPLVGVYGGGTWPRFVPAARRAVTVVQPLPCFGCDWECAFGDAPCVKLIAEADVSAAVDFALAQGDADFGRIQRVEYLSAETRGMMGVAAANYRALRADHRARQAKIEEKESGILEKERAIAEKQQEINTLKGVCDEREKWLKIVDGHAHALTDQLNTLRADHALLRQTLDRLPADSAAAARALNDQATHIRNIESLLQARERELAEWKATATNRANGLHDLEQAKHYGRLLGEKEAVIQSMKRGYAERDALIQRLSAEATGLTAGLHKLGLATSACVREKLWRPLDTWLFRKVVEDYWMQIGILRHYEPRVLRWDDRLPGPRLPDARLPQVALVTPSYGQEKFIERTLLSVLDQHYPKLLYVVQDGGSKDRSAEIIARHAPRLRHWESVADHGQADAIHRGFAHIAGALGPDDVMAWLNSDDLLAPGSLRGVAEFFATHPDVDAVYGHRIIIDDHDRDVGRWIMPRHNSETLEWIDYVPQETLFWRKRAWDLAGGIDPSFQFALDWDLLARFQLAGCRIRRLPYFLGAFRVHPEQKTSQAIHTVGAEEMRRIRTRFHGERQDDAATIDQHARETRFWGAITARLHEVGIRW